MAYEVTTQQVMDAIAERFGFPIPPPCPYDNIPKWEWDDAWRDAFEKHDREPTEDETLTALDSARERRSNESPWLDYEPAEDCA